MGSGALFWPLYATTYMRPTHKQNTDKIKPAPGEMVQGLKAQTALAEDLSSVPSAHASMLGCSENYL